MASHKLDGLLRVSVYAMTSSFALLAAHDVQGLPLLKHDLYASHTLKSFKKRSYSSMIAD